MFTNLTTMSEDSLQDPTEVAIGQLTAQEQIAYWKILALSSKEQLKQVQEVKEIAQSVPLREKPKKIKSTDSSRLTLKDLGLDTEQSRRIKRFFHIILTEAKIERSKTFMDIEPSLLDNWIDSV